ncbi:MAG: hypothetical protein AAF514_18810, partial [Verrucomicrobiota bacterium]
MKTFLQLTFLAGILALFPQTLPGEVLYEEDRPLIVRGESLDHVSDWIDLSSPLNSRAIFDLEITAARERLVDGEEIEVTIELEGESSVELLSLSAGDRWPTGSTTFRNLVGDLARASISPKEARISVRLSSSSVDTTIEIKNLRFEKIGILPEMPLRSVPPLDEFLVELVDLTTGTTTRILDLSEATAETVAFQVLYTPLGGREIDLETLGDDNICLGSFNPLLGVQANVEFIRMEVRENASVLANYEIHRPEEGWGTTSKYGQDAVYVCFDNVRTTSGARGGGFLGRVRLPEISENTFSEFRLLGTPAHLDRKQIFIDLELEMPSEIVSPVNLDDGDLFFLSGLGGVEEATFQGVSKVVEGRFVATYRFERPEIGWGYGPQPILINPNIGKGIRPSLPLLHRELLVMGSLQAPGTDPFDFEVLDEPIDPGAPEFMIRVKFSNENGVNVNSIGDGDIAIAHFWSTGSNGRDEQARLISLEASQDQLEVVATFAIDRNPLAWVIDGFMVVVVSAGAVEDLAGNRIGSQADTYKGQATNIDQQMDLEIGFIPLGGYGGDLTEYHFRFIYQSPEPIDTEDFQWGNHIRGVVRSVGLDGVAYQDPNLLTPSMLDWRSSNEGRTIEADYVISRPESGWPRILSLFLNPHSIRDVNGKTAIGDTRAITDIGPDFEDGVNVTLLDGLQVDDAAESHEVSLLFEAADRLNLETLSGSALWFGWHPELIPGLVDFDLPPPVPGRLVRLTPVGGDGEVLANYQVILHRFPSQDPLNDFDGLKSSVVLGITEDSLHVRIFDSQGEL